MEPVESMSKFQTPDVPFVESKTHGGKQKPKVISLFPTNTNSNVGAALAVAQNWHRNGHHSWVGHYVVDEQQRFRCVRDNVIARSDGTIKGEIRIAVCAEPTSRTHFWSEDEHGDVLDRSAKLVAELSLAYRIPIKVLGDEKFSGRTCKVLRPSGVYFYQMNNLPLERFLLEVETQRSLLLTNRKDDHAR